MKVMRKSVTILAMLFILAASHASAGGGREIPVEPGDGTISAAVAGAKAGDVLLLAKGTFHDSVELPEGVELRGEGADATILIGQGFATINCSGDNVIRGIQVRGSEQTIRGINSSMPVRVEKSRFVELLEAVALMAAPLSDVIHCEFIDCGIGVRAIGNASPTVWGCLFRGGRTGVFGMGGSPYIRNNVFHGVALGVHLVPEGSAMPIVRNNVFLECESSGIMLMGQGGVFQPSVRNNVFDGCEAAMIGPPSGYRATSHNAIRNMSTSPWRDNQKNPHEQPSEAHVIKVGDDVRLNENYVLVDESGDRVLMGEGLRLGSEPEGTTGAIGLTLETGPVGVSLNDDVELPAARFLGPVHVSNATAEQHQFIRARRMRMTRQSLTFEDGKPFDVHDVQHAGKASRIKFDISRYFGERSLNTR